jgi:hypothetical protein
MSDVGISLLGAYVGASVALLLVVYVVWAVLTARARHRGRAHL